MAGKRGVQGMRRTPDGIHRRPADRLRPPVRYAVWQTLEDRSVLLGWTRRLAGHRVHRVFAVTGEFQRQVTGWVGAVEWLVQVRDGHDRTSETSRADETQSVLTK